MSFHVNTALCSQAIVFYLIIFDILSCGGVKSLEGVGCYYIGGVGISTKFFILKGINT